MTRLMACGWETGHKDEIPNSFTTDAPVVTLSVLSSNVRNGTRALQLVSTSGSYSARYVWSIDVAKTEIWTRLGFKVEKVAGSNSTQVKFLAFYDSAGAEALHLRYDHNTGIISAVRGSTVVATSSGAFSVQAAPGVWHLVEARYKPSNASGVLELYLDGTQVINFAGDATNGLEDVLALGLCLEEGSGIGSSGDAHVFDDWVVNDTAGAVNNGRPNNGAVLLLSPTGAGSSTQLTRGGTDSGANWSQVEEVPPSDADYVQSSTIAQRDLYALANMPGPASVVHSVSVIARAREEISGIGQIGLTRKSGATITEAPAVPLESTYRFYNALLETNPETSLAYTVTSIDAMEAGVTVR